MPDTCQMPANPQELEEATADAKPSAVDDTSLAEGGPVAIALSAQPEMQTTELHADISQDLVAGAGAKEASTCAGGEREEAAPYALAAAADAMPSAVEQPSVSADTELREAAGQPDTLPMELHEEQATHGDDVEQVAELETPTVSSLFAHTLQALKDEGRELARLHHEAKERAAGRLPALGSLLDAEEELLEALVELRGLSPLLLVDGGLGVGKSSLINALLLGVDSEDQSVRDPSYASSGRMRTRSPKPSQAQLKHAPFTPPIRLGRPGGRGQRLLLVRPPASSIESGRRYLEGKPSLAEGSKAEAAMCVLSEDEWLQRLLGDSATGIAPDADPAIVEAEDNRPLPLVLEDHRVCRASGCGLWLAEVDIQDSAALETRWVVGCSDVLCLVRAAGGGNLGVLDETRVRMHLEAGRQVLLIVNQCDVELEPSIPPPAEVEELVSKALAINPVSSIHAVSLLRSRCNGSRFEDASEEADMEMATYLPDSPTQRWNTAWARCRQGIQEFAAGAEQRRLAQARECVRRGREAFVHWCTQGAKVVTAATKGFQQDAENVRLARDIINRNIDAEYLAHVFSSVLVGKFDGMCAALATLAAPDLGNAWGRHATRKVMEEHLRKELEQRLRLAMQESLFEVTAEMSKQEQPAFDEIRRVARRGATVPWDAEVKKLELALRPDQLQHFAMHFFGSLAVGVLSGLGAAALEMLLAELMLGPVGIVAGVATFVAFGVQTADWPSVREAFVKQVRSRHVELVEKARGQLDFPGLCERRRRRILEQMDIILQRLLAEVGALSESANEFARCALVLQTWQVQAT